MYLDALERIARVKVIDVLHAGVALNECNLVGACLLEDAEYTGGVYRELTFGDRT
jgi:hypothetical protein